MKLFILLFTWFMGGNPMYLPEAAQTVQPTSHQPMDAAGETGSLQHTYMNNYVSGDPEHLNQTLVIFEDTHFRIRN